MVEEKYIGLALAIVSSVAIGASFVFTKKGLNEAAETDGFEGDGFSYLRHPIWWAGIITMVVGEICNFSAYAFAPAILVTPLGALSVLIGAVLGSYFLGERLGTLGKLGCAICLIGSVVIVLHAPPDEEITSVGQILNDALHPAFIIYGCLVTVFAVIMIYRIAPKYGRKNPLVYLSVCSSVGGISVMAIKALGIAVKLTLGGNNQFWNPSTYVFMIMVAVCILTQMNYFNKALSQFSTNIVNPLYYVTFTTCTLLSSFLLFRGFNTEDPINTISLLCGFLVIFAGVYLLNLSREDPEGHHQLASKYGVIGTDAIPTDGLSQLATRRSMQARRSTEGMAWSPGGLHGRHSRVNSINSVRSHNRHSSGSGGEDRSLMHSYDMEMGRRHGSNVPLDEFGLADLAEDDEDDDSGGKRTSFDGPLSAHSHNGSVRHGGPRSAGLPYESVRPKQ